MATFALSLFLSGDVVMSEFGGGGCCITADRAFPFSFLWRRWAFLLTLWLLAALSVAAAGGPFGCSPATPAQLDVP